MSKTIVLRPHLNEKTYALSKAAKQVYVFHVSKEDNKHSIARAVEAQFEVKVAEVNTVSMIGKAKRTISISGKRVRNGEGKRSDTKKAYVTLQAGFSLPFFDAVEEAEQKEAVQEKLTAKASKSAAQEAKKEAKTDKPKRLGFRRNVKDEEVL